MKNFCILVLIGLSVLSCNSEGSSTPALDSVNKQADSMAGGTWDSGKQEQRVLKQEIMNELGRRDSLIKQ